MKDKEFPSSRVNLCRIWSFAICSQAIEEGNLDEVEGLKKLKKQRKRNYEYVDEEEEEEDESASKSAKVEKPVVKKRRGRPPVEKPQPNPPKLTRNMKKLMETMTTYKDG